MFHIEIISFKHSVVLKAYFFDNNLTSFFISLGFPLSNMQGVSIRPCGKSAEYSLLPFTRHAIVPPLLINSVQIRDISEVGDQQ